MVPADEGRDRDHHSVAAYIESSPFALEDLLGEPLELALYRG
jgi:hypothetical protein